MISPSVKILAAILSFCRIVERASNGLYGRVSRHSRFDTVIVMAALGAISLSLGLLLLLVGFWAADVVSVDDLRRRFPSIFGYWSPPLWLLLTR